MEMIRQALMQAANQPQQISNTLPSLTGGDVWGLFPDQAMQVNQMLQRDAQSQVQQQMQMREQVQRAQESEKDRAQQLKLANERFKNEEADRRLREQIAKAQMEREAKREAELAKYRQGTLDLQKSAQEGLSDYRNRSLDLQERGLALRAAGGGAGGGAGGPRGQVVQWTDPETGKTTLRWVTPEEIQAGYEVPGQMQSGGKAPAPGEPTAEDLANMRAKFMAAYDDYAANARILQQEPMSLNEYVEERMRIAYPDGNRPAVPVPSAPTGPVQYLIPERIDEDGHVIYRKSDGS